MGVRDHRVRESVCERESKNFPFLKNQNWGKYIQLKMKRYKLADSKHQIVFVWKVFFFCLFFSCVKLLPWILLVGGSKSNLLSFYRKVIVHFHKGKRREIKSNNWKTEKTGDRDRIRALKMSIEWTTPPHPTSRCCCFNNALIVRSKQSTQHTNSTR